MALIKKGGGKRTSILQKEESSEENDQAQPSAHSPLPRIRTPSSDGDSAVHEVPKPPPPSASHPPAPDASHETQGMSELEALVEGSILQNRYRIEGILGVGGMSVVYRARDMRFKDVKRECAIKEMFQRAPDSQTRMLNLRHFEREASLLAALSHPSIPKVYDFFEESGRVYLVQELVYGKDMEVMLDDKGEPFEELRVGNWAIQICDVLTYLHTHKPEPIVFRDMKPSNALVTPEDRVVLIDFGIARLLDPSSRKGTMIGTEGYAPPEQYKGMAEPQGDIYALGATMHHLLTNSDPRQETPFTFQERPIRKLNANVSEEMEAIVNRALEYDIAARWSNAEELKQALLGVSGMGVVAPKVSTIQSSAPTRSGLGSTKLIWDFTCNDEVRSSPCIGHDIVFIGSYDQHVYAIDAKTGKREWAFKTDGGVSSSPAIWQDLVIVGSEDGAVYGIDMRGGMRRWIFRTEKAVRSSPRMQDRVVFIGSDDQNFYALDGLRGVLIWNYRSRMPFRSSATTSKDDVFVGCDDSHVYCIEIRTTKVKWKQRTQQPVMSSPCYHDGIVYVGSLDTYVYAFDSESGTIIWKCRTGHYVYSSPIVVDEHVYVGSSDGMVYALERKKGRVVWKYDTESQVTSRPCYDNGRLYFGAVDNNIYCLDASSGKRMWKYETEGPVVSSPVVHNDIVYVGSMDHRVYALQA